MRQVAAANDRHYVKGAAGWPGPEDAMSDAAVTDRRSLIPLVLVASLAGLMLAATIGLWAHYGTAVIFEMIRTGFVACFG